MNNIKTQSFKIQIVTAITVVFFVASATYIATNRIKDIESNIRHLNGKTDLYTKRYAETLQQQSVLNIEVAKMQIKLSNIEALIIDVKERLK